METATIAERTFAVLGGNNASRQPAISETQPEQQLSDIQNEVSMTRRLALGVLHPAQCGETFSSVF